MLGKLQSAGDNHFMASIKQDPLIVVLDVISVKPKSLKATVRKHDLMLVQSMESRHCLAIHLINNADSPAAKNSMDS
jgi:hypothetical protein